MKKTKKTKKPKTSFINRALNIVERVGNALPHPASLFAIFALMALVASTLGHWFNLQVIHPATGEVIKTVNLLSKTGIERIIDEMVRS